MTGPVKTLVIGGVTFNADDVASTSKGKDRFYNDIFTVVFKTGEKLTFPEHDELLCPTVNSTREKGLIYDDTTFEMSYIFGATFTSSNKTVTNVKLDHSYDCNIDLSANRSVYYSDKADIIGGVGNKIILDKQDAVYVNGKLVKQGQGEYKQR